MVKISRGGWPDMSTEIADHQSQRVNPKNTGLFLSVQHWRGFFFHPLCKIRSIHSRELKLTGLIAYIIFNKICKFESWTITNDVITKTMENFGPPRNQTNYISFENYENYAKIWLLLNLSQCAKSYGHFSQILAFFYARSPWSVPKMQMSKMFYFVLILHLILGKVTKFLADMLSISKVISQNPHGGGGGTPPSLVPFGFRVDGVV